MKRILLIGFILGSVLVAFCSGEQNVSCMPPDTGIMTYRSNGDTTRIRIGRKELHIADSDSRTFVEILDLVTQKKDTVYAYEGSNLYDAREKQKGDTTRIRIGKRIFHIIETQDNTILELVSPGTDKADTTVIFSENNSGDEHEKDENTGRYENTERSTKIRKEKITNASKGHYAGIGCGWNNYIDQYQSLTRVPGNEFMDIRTGKSLAFVLNLFDYRLPLAGRYIGLVTGLGIEFNNYHFKNNNTIERVDGITVSKQPVPGAVYKKNKLATGYLTVPLLLSIDFPTYGGKQFYVSAGICGSIKTWSYTKEVYVQNSKDFTYRVHDDFNLSPFRYGLMARIGYGSLCLFAEYCRVPFFIKNKGPELYPLTIGLALTNWLD